MTLYITKIKLKNYRCYEDEEFLMQDAKELKSPIALIYGVEGSGKTTVFNSVGWALYGDETETLLNEARQDLAIPNLNAFSDSNRAKVSVSVEVMFQKNTEEISRVKVTRMAEYLKGMAEPNYSSCDIDIFYRNGKTRTISNESDRPDFNGFMDRYFPRKLVEFYMFTGEYLKRTYATKGANLQKGIMDQFKIGAIVQMDNTLNDIKQQYAKVARRKSKDPGLQKELTSVEEKKKRFEDQLQSTEENISVLGDQLREEDNNIVRYTEDYGRLKEKSERIRTRDQLSDDLRTKKDQISKLESSLFRNIFEKAQFLNAEEKLAKIIKTIDGEVGNRKLPPDIEAPFIRSLLESRICICGREVTARSVEEGRLLHILDQKEPEQGMEILTYLQSPIRIINDSLSGWKEDILQTRKDLEKAIGEERKLSRELSSISELEKGLNDAEKEIKDKYESAVRRKEEISGEREQDIGKKERIKNELSKIERRIEEINKEIFKENESAKDVQDANRHYKIADSIQEALKQIPQDLFMSYSDSLQRKIEEVLKSFDAVSQFAVKISYNEKGLSFAFKELSPEFKEFGAYISGGQNQLVGICMMASFISVLEDIGLNVVEPPFVFMDHPISNLSEKGKALFQEKLTDIFKGIQVLIIATDGEVPGFLEHCGKENISKLYVVENDIAKKVSRKKEVA